MYTSSFVSMNGRVRVFKTFANGRIEDVYADRNLIVGLGRRVMSRRIAADSPAPSIAIGTAPAIEVVRSTATSPTSAAVGISQIGNTNSYLLTLYKNNVAEGTTLTLVPGDKTITQVVSHINGISGWRARALPGMGDRDAMTLLPVRRASALGNAGTYANDDSVRLSPYKRTLFAVYSATDTSVPQTSLAVTRLRWGTEGHVASLPLQSIPAAFADERMICGLRASEYGSVDADTDYLPVVSVYPNTGIVTFTAVLGPGDANGLSLSEAGLFTDRYMIAKKNFGQIPKTSDFSLSVEWSLVF